MPTPFFRHRGEDDASFHARKLSEFEAYLDAHAKDLGVLLIEPQWGSSAAAMVLTKAERQTARWKKWRGDIDVPPTKKQLRAKVCAFRCLAARHEACSSCVTQCAPRSAK